MVAEVGEDAAHRVDDRVAAAGKGDVGEALLFLKGELASVEIDPIQVAEKVVARLLLRALELVAGVRLQHMPVARIVIAVMEYMDAPADPDLGLRLRHFQQPSERTALQRQREFAYGLELALRHRVGDHFVHERLHVRDVFRVVLGPVEHRLHQRTVVGVLRRVDFQRQLADAARGSLRMQHAHQRVVAAEGFPVLGALAHVLHTQDEREGFVLTVDVQRGALRSRFLEGIGVFRHRLAPWLWYAVVWFRGLNPQHPPARDAGRLSEFSCRRRRPASR